MSGDAGVAAALEAPEAEAAAASAAAAAGRKSRRGRRRRHGGVRKAREAGATDGASPGGTSEDDAADRPLAAEAAGPGAVASGATSGSLRRPVPPPWRSVVTWSDLGAHVLEEDRPEARAAPPRHGVCSPAAVAGRFQASDCPGAPVGPAAHEPAAAASLAAVGAAVARTSASASASSSVAPGIWPAAMDPDKDWRMAAWGQLPPTVAYHAPDEWTSDHSVALRQWLCNGATPAAELESLLRAQAYQAYED